MYMTLKTCKFAVASNIIGQHEIVSTYVQLNDTEVHDKAYNAVLS